MSSNSIRDPMGLRNGFDVNKTDSNGTTALALKHKFKSRS